MLQKILFPILFFFCVTLLYKAHAQDYIKGRVLSAKDSTGIYGASIYLDGTSYGVSAGENGEFKMPVVKSSFAALIVSSMGYETLALNLKETISGKNIIVYLQESLETLDEVIVAEDTWSRSKKLGIFRREFLGRTPAALKCKISNEDALQLRYNPVNETLTAYSTEPLMILNRHLGYEITYNLEDFVVQFSTGSSGLQLVQIVYYEGYSFFTDLKRKPSRRILSNRENAFKGSALHFMRSLANKSLNENGYRIFRKNFEVPPYDFFDISRHQEEVQINLLENNLNILYQKREQSAIENNGPFSIDRLGNHFPPRNVMFGGAIGIKRIAEMVPLNYKL